MKYFISRFIPRVPSEEEHEEYLSVIDGIMSLDKDAEILQASLTPENIRQPLLFISDSVKLLNDADIAVFIKGWTRSKICQIEYQCAEKFGIPIREGYVYRDRQTAHLNSQIKE